jgi:long-chain acyl-CoA synthetase
MDLFYRRFSQSASRIPDAIAVEMQRRDHTETLKYVELHRMAESVGAWLRQNSIAPGSRCAIFADNSARWVVSYLGTYAQGCTAVPLDSNYHADQVHKLLLDSGAHLVFCDTKHLPLAREAVAETAVKIVLMEGADADIAGNLDAMIAEGSEGFVASEPKESDLAVLLYTSGTTSDPKGVMLSHGNLAFEVDSVAKLVKYTERDAILGILPLFHSLAQITNLLLPFSVGARVVYLETLNTTELLRGLQDRGITSFCVVPQFFYLIHERIEKEINKSGFLTKRVFNAMLALNRNSRKIGINLGKALFGKIHATFGKHMRLLVTGGSRFDPEIAREFYALGIDILQAYGLTETTGGATVTPPGNLVIGSVGKPIPGVEVKIVDPQPPDSQSTDDTPPSGEIAIRGPNVMLGYYNRPDANAAAFRDGWLLSGDLGYIDSRGQVFITGRRKELIVLANGKNLYPDEIESYYLKSEFIKEICVMALAGVAGDPKKEQLHAVIVPNFEALKEKKIVNAKEAIRWDVEGISHDLPSVKRILSYDIWQEELPRTTTRKIKRFEVEKRVKEQHARGEAGGDALDDKTPAKELSAADTEWMEQADVERVLPIIHEASKENVTIGPDTSLELDLGLDSMQRIELLVSIEEELGGKVDEAQLGEIYTVRQLVDAVVASVAAGGGKRTEAAGWSTVLQEEPTDPDVLALARPQAFWSALWFVGAKFVYLLSRLLSGLKVTGMENIPEKGPFILSSNHQSYIDPAILGAILPWKHFKNLFSVGTSEIFGKGIMHWLAGQLHVVVVDPDANLVPAMKAGAYGLRNGKILILYPEGERSVDGSPKRFKKGAAILATHLHVPIVPIAIEGFYDAWPRGKPFFQKFTSKFSMAFGPPIPPPDGEPTELLATQMMATVRAKVVEMWTPLNREYRAKTGPSAKAAD